jgi:hypothetical protein
MVAQNIDNWRLIKTYGINGRKDVPDYYTQLITILEIMLDFAAPKIPESEEPAIVQRIEDYLKKAHNLFIAGQGGKIMYNAIAARELYLNISQLFRYLLRRIDETGMLTKRHSDPRIAISDIE